MATIDDNDRETQPAEASGGSAGCLVATILLSPLLYVLSIGPVARLAEEGLLPREPVVAFYTPVIWLHQNTPLREPLEWYGALWGWQ